MTHCWRPFQLHLHLGANLDPRIRRALPAMSTLADSELTYALLCSASMRHSNYFQKNMQVAKIILELAGSDCQTRHISVVFGPFVEVPSQLPGSLPIG